MIPQSIAISNYYAQPLPNQINQMNIIPSGNFPVSMMGPLNPMNTYNNMPLDPKFTKVKRKYKIKKNK